MGGGPPTVREFTTTHQSAEDQATARDLHLAQVINGAVSEAVKEAARAIDARLLTETQRRWVEMAIEREGRRAALHRAIVEKTLTGAIWAGALWLGSVLVEYFKNHGWKP